MRIKIAIIVAAALFLAGASLLFSPVRGRVRALVRNEPPPRITPLALSTPVPAMATRAPTATTIPSSTPTPRPTVTTDTPLPALTATMVEATATPAPTAMPTAIPTTAPTPLPTPATVEVNGRRYAAYLPAATKESQFFQYSCEFDAAWVILATYGFDLGGEALIDMVPHDRSVEPYIEETASGFIIHGGDITNAYSGDYTKNFLARSTSSAIRPLFQRFGLDTTLVRDRSGLETALRSGQLVWMKTTVDFNTWRPATWVEPDGTTHRTVLGNDHAVVAMGFSERGVVIRDVLGPTSTNRQRPYEYEVDWTTFMAAWGAQSFDALAVAPPR